MLSKKLTLKNIRKHIVGIDQKVPLANGKKARYINLDNAASTPPLQHVMDIVNEFMPWYSSIHRGTGFKSQLSTKVYDDAHQLITAFVGADPDKNVVILGKNATEAINKLSYRLNLQKSDVVLTSLMEHHSNDLPWRQKSRTIHIDIDEQGKLDHQDLEKKLLKYYPHVKLVTLTGASNVTGWINDIHRIAQIVHEYQAQLLVDVAQLIPHRKVTMLPNDDPAHIDYLAFSAHKMYAPFGTGVLIGPKETFLKTPPEYVGGGTIDVVTTNHVIWAGLPDREEAGSPNVIGAVALSSALKVLKHLDMKNIANHEQELTTYAISELKKIKGSTLYGSTNSKEKNRVGVIAFSLKNISDSLLAAFLSYEAGIGVRNGCFCAQPYLHRLLKLTPQEIQQLAYYKTNHQLEKMPGLVRISFGMYNNKKDINQLIKSLRYINDNIAPLRKNYVFSQEEGLYHPKGLSYDYDSYFTI